MKKILFILMACLLGQAAFANGGAEGGGKTVIGLSIATLNSPFFVVLVDEAKATAEELGYEMIVLDAQDNPSKQLNDIEDLIRKKISVLLINPTDSDAVVTAIKSANQAGIPVITVDRSASGGDVISHVASDNIAGGMMAGEYLLSIVGDGAKVIELEGIPGTSAARERGEGFNEVIKGSLNVVARQPANFNRSEGLSVMENLLQSNKDIKGVFAHNDEMALGALKALEAAGMNDVVVVGFDANDDAVASVKAGEMKATVAQKPALIGELAVRTADKIIKGESVDSVINVELALVK